MDCFWSEFAWFLTGLYVGWCALAWLLIPYLVPDAVGRQEEE